MTDLLHALPDWIVAGLEIATVMGSLLGAAGGVGAWLTRNALVTKRDLAGHAERFDRELAQIHRRLADGNERFAKIENELRHVPSAETVAALVDRIAGVQAAVSSLTATVDGVMEVIARIERPLNILVESHLKESRR